MPTTDHSHCPVCGAMWQLKHTGGANFTCQNHACGATMTLTITSQPNNPWSKDDHK